MYSDVILLRRSTTNYVIPYVASIYSAKVCENELKMVDINPNPGWLNTQEAKQLVNW